MYNLSKLSTSALDVSVVYLSTVRALQDFTCLQNYSIPSKPLRIIAHEDWKVYGHNFQPGSPCNYDGKEGECLKDQTGRER